MGCASFLFTDFESSPGTEIFRVRIADWSSVLEAANEEETRPEKQKDAFKEKI
jgi:hypothetical protein